MVRAAMADKISSGPASVRRATTTAVRYRVVGEDQWLEGQTVNISESGVLFQAAEPLVPETIIEMTFRVPDRMGPLAGELMCVGRVVRRASAASSTVHFSIAATFVEVRAAE